MYWIRWVRRTFTHQMHLRSVDHVLLWIPFHGNWNIKAKKFGHWFLLVGRVVTELTGQRQWFTGHVERCATRRFQFPFTQCDFIFAVAIQNAGIFVEAFRWCYCNTIHKSINLLRIFGIFRVSLTVRTRNWRETDSGGALYERCECFQHFRWENLFNLPCTYVTSCNLTAPDYEWVSVGMTQSLVWFTLRLSLPTWQRCKVLSNCCTLDFSSASTIFFLFLITSFHRRAIFVGTQTEIPRKIIKITAFSRSNCVKIGARSVCKWKLLKMNVENEVLDIQKKLVKMSSPDGSVSDRMLEWTVSQRWAACEWLHIVVVASLLLLAFLSAANRRTRTDAHTKTWIFCGRQMKIDCFCLVGAIFSHSTLHGAFHYLTPSVSFCRAKSKRSICWKHYKVWTLICTYWRKLASAWQWMICENAAKTTRWLHYRRHSSKIGKNVWHRASAKNHRHPHHRTTAPNRPANHRRNRATAPANHLIQRKTTETKIAKIATVAVAAAAAVAVAVINKHHFHHRPPPMPFAWNAVKCWPPHSKLMVNHQKVVRRPKNWPKNWRIVSTVNSRTPTCATKTEFARVWPIWKMSRIQRYVPITCRVRLPHRNWPKCCRKRWPAMRWRNCVRNSWKRQSTMPNWRQYRAPRLICWNVANAKNEIVLTIKSKRGVPMNRWQHLFCVMCVAIAGSSVRTGDRRRQSRHTDTDRV